MTINNRPTSVPRWVVVAVLAGGGLSVVYSIVITGSLTALLDIWSNLLEPVVLLFAVYLLYRLVLAVETIAEK